MTQPLTSQGKMRGTRKLILVYLGVGGVCFLVVLCSWLLVSGFVVYRLTHRLYPPFEETAPSLDWARFESLRLSTQDGEELGAWYSEGEPDAPSVLLVHGIGAARTHFLSRAEVFARRGYSVFLVTLRAHGDSTGEFNDIGLSARHDVVAAVDELQRRRPGRPLVVMGTSMGAAAALFASGELGNRVSGYILESPFETLRRAVRNRTENALPPVLDWVAYQGLLITAHWLLPEFNNIAPVRAIRSVPADVPVLILAGRLDRAARPDEARALHAQVRQHGQLLFFEAASHSNLLENDPERYQRTVIGFMERFQTEQANPALTRVDPR